MLKIRHYVGTIFVMLGSSCNLNCKYCMQHALIETPVPARNLDAGIIDFIAAHAAESDKPLDVRFYGGEPLIYMDDIRQIVHLLKEKQANVRFSIISNGKLLTEEIVQFFNAHNFEVAISWDGDNVSDTRRYDVVKEHRAELLQIDNLSIDGVLTSYNYIYDFLQANVSLQDEYKKLHGYTYKVFTDEIMDCDNSSRELTNVDLKRVYEQSEAVVKKALSDEVEHSTLSRMCFEIFYRAVFRSMISEKSCLSKDYCACSNAVCTINLDLDGNLYQCHNNWKKVGNIFLDNYETYMAHAVINENISRHNHENHCKDCEASLMCSTGCPLIGQPMREKTGYCEMKKASFLPFIKEIRKMQERPEEFSILQSKDMTE